MFTERFAQHTHEFAEIGAVQIGDNHADHMIRLKSKLDTSRISDVFKLPHGPKHFIPAFFRNVRMIVQDAGYGRFGDPAMAGNIMNGWNKNHSFLSY